jgi:hypothetical protein
MEIPLINGGVAIIDDADYPLVAKFRWRSRKREKERTAYAFRHFRNNGRLYWQPMHRLILGLLDPNVYTDHRNHNGLDNRRENLRVATRSQNQGNRAPNTNNKTGFKGVCLKLRKHRKPHWRARISQNGKPRFLGQFQSPIAAALAYDKAAIAKWGPFAYTNFPTKSEIVPRG